MALALARYSDFDLSISWPEQRSEEKFLSTGSRACRAVCEKVKEDWPDFLLCFLASRVSAPLFLDLACLRDIDLAELGAPSVRKKTTQRRLLGILCGNSARDILLCREPNETSWRESRSSPRVPSANCYLILREATPHRAARSTERILLIA